MVRKVSKLALKSKNFNTIMTPDYDHVVQKGYTFHFFFIPRHYVLIMLVT